MNKTVCFVMNKQKKKLLHEMHAKEHVFCYNARNGNMLPLYDNVDVNYLKH